jgi:hypothetical protein
MESVPPEDLEQPFDELTDEEESFAELLELPSEELDEIGGGQSSAAILD